MIDDGRDMVEDWTDMRWMPGRYQWGELPSLSDWAPLHTTKEGRYAPQKWKLAIVHQEN